MNGASVCFAVCLCIATCRAQSCTVTSAAEEGPYYKAGAPLIKNSGSICDWQRMRNGTQLMVRGRVYRTGCRTGQSSILDIWSADPSGAYSPTYGPDYTCRGKVSTDANGNYQFLTVIPGRYKMGVGYRPSHIHFKVSRSNQAARVFTTQMYFQNDPYIKNDACGRSCKAGNPTLTMPLQNGNGQSYMMNFNIVLG